MRSHSLDHVVVFGEAHMGRILKIYATYYNRARTHLSLDKDAPTYRHSHTVGQIVAIPVLGGLHHQIRPGLDFDLRTAGYAAIAHQIPRSKENVSA